MGYLVMLSHPLDPLLPLFPLKAILEPVMQSLDDYRTKTIGKILLIPLESVRQEIVIELAKVRCPSDSLDGSEVIRWDREGDWLGEGNVGHVVWRHDCLLALSVLQCK